MFLYCFSTFILSNIPSITNPIPAKAQKKSLLMFVKPTTFNIERIAIIAPAIILFHIEERPCKPYLINYYISI
jgi:hypothetical protein